MSDGTASAVAQFLVFELDGEMFAVDVNGIRAATPAPPLSRQ